MLPPSGANDSSALSTMEFLFCSSKILPPITRNTEIWEVLTPCLVYSLVPLISVGCSLLTLVFVLLSVWIDRAESLGFANRWTRLKAELSVVSLIVSLLWALPDGLFVSADGFQHEHFVHLFGNFLFNLFTCISYALCIRFGIISSGLLHLTWTLRMITLIPLNLFFLDGLLNSMEDARTPAFGLCLSVAEFAISCVMVVLLWFPDGSQARNYRHLDQPPPVSATNSFGQSVMYTYTVPLLRQSFRGPVEYEDFWASEKRNRSDVLARAVGNEKPASVCGLLWLMLRISWLDQLKGNLNGVWTCFLSFINYFVIALIMQVVSGDYPLWMGCLVATLPSLLMCVRQIGVSVGYVQVNLAYFSIRSCLNGMIFDKMLRLSPTVQTKTSSGEIINHMTVDLMRTRIFWLYLKDFFVCPALILVSGALLARLVGILPASMGLLVLFFFMIANVLTSRFSMRFSRAQMNFKDERLKLISDILNGIRVWKLYGWERSMEKLAERVRAKELNELKKCIPCDAFLDGSFDMGPAVATLATFYFYLVVKENALDPATAFMVLFLFTLVRVSINFLPQLFSCTVNAYISMKRLVKFLNQEERPPVDHVLSPLLDADEVVHLQDAAFSWTGNSEDFALRDLNLRVRKGELLAVLGAVGSGKSTLLHALCNELQPTSGAAAIRPLRTAYVSQQAFIQNLTLRDNVLFDAELQPALYDRTLEACALKVDLQSLPSGDLTEIGEKGINLSGGQKARVSLARAVYFQADFYVLDDPFSAVDAHVGEHLFEQVVGPNGMLNRTTRVVALNSAAHLHLFDKIVCLTDGRITHCDTYQSLAQDPTSPIAKLLSKGSAKKKRTSLKEKKQPDESSQSSTSNDDDEEEEGEKKAREVDVLIEKEDQRHGKVHYAIYWDYIQAFGPLNFAIFLFMLMGVSTGMVAASNIFLANWSSSVNRTAEPALGNLEIYASLAVGGSVVLFFSFLLLGYGGFKASKWFHKELVGKSPLLTALLFPTFLAASVVRAKMSWFDCTPLGRILNRFSADMEFCDSNMIPMCANVFFSLQEIAYSLLSIFFAIPWLSLALVPYFVLFVIIVRFFNSSFAQFRRMSTSSLSTLCSVVGDAYNGASSIRVFGRVGQFRQLLNKRMDRYTEANFVEQVTSGWMKGILCLLTNLMIMFFLLAGIWTAHRGFLSLGLLGMIVNSSFSMSRMFSGLAQVFRSVETEIVSVERLKEFINIEREPIWAKSSTKKPLEKISSAKIEFENIWLRYREQDDPVLKGVSFVVQPGEKIGIVGRTGAGKTSLTSVLFRLIEPFDGTIRIGNGDIRDYGTNLRRLLTIIPQDPVLFCGSLRSNLDPFEEFDDQELWAALRKAHLHDYVVGLSGKLDSEVTEGGTNLSVGQRQLVCLARALLRTASILVLDEATAAVDAETDRLIQETIRTNFSTSTILTIAHRLHTIMDYDKVLVMDAGRVREFDAIDRLLNDRSSAFRTFAEKAGLIH